MNSYYFPGTCDFGFTISDCKPFTLQAKRNTVEGFNFNFVHNVEKHRMYLLPSSKILVVL